MATVPSGILIKLSGDNLPISPDSNDAEPLSKKS